MCGTTILTILVLSCIQFLWKKSHFGVYLVNHIMDVPTIVEDTSDAPLTKEKTRSPHLLVNRSGLYQ